MRFASLGLFSLALSVAHASELTFPKPASGENIEGFNKKGDLIADNGAFEPEPTEPTPFPIATEEPGLSTRGLLSEQRRNIGLTQLGGLCLAQNNLATSATPSGSGGGVGGVGPNSMNDGYCSMYWPQTTAAQGGTIQYVWNTSVTVDHMVLISDAPCPGLAPSFGTCAFESGRSIAQGTVQYWDIAASTWNTVGSFASVLSDEIVFQFPSCITTTALRVIDLRTPLCNQQWNVKVREWAVCECAQQPIVPLDDMCQNLPGSMNVAPNAVATSSGGGVGVFGTQNMNDESPYCIFHWPLSTQYLAGGPGADIEYNWSAPVTLQETIIATDAFCGQQAGCQQAQGRGITSGNVEYWDGAAWVSAGSFSGSQGERIHFAFAPCVTTTALRVTNMMVHACNGGFVGHPVVYEWAACTC